MPAFCTVPVFVKVSRFVLWVAVLFDAEVVAFDFVLDVFAADDFAVFLELVDTEFFTAFDVVFTVLFTAGIAAAAVLIAIVIFFLSES